FTMLHPPNVAFFPYTSLFRSVVAIIAILAAIAVPNFLEAQTRSKVSRVQNDLRSIATAMESYFIDNRTYPAASREATHYFKDNRSEEHTSELQSRENIVCSLL